MNYLLQLWRGQIGLGITFWFYGFFMQAMLIIVEHTARNISPEAGTRAFLISLVYYCFFSVALWRASVLYEDEQNYVRLARFLMFLGWLRYLWVVYG